MFDNLRRQTAEGAPSEEVPHYAAARPSRSARAFLGLTPPQQFILSFMLFLNVTVLGCLALMVFEKIDISKLLPF